MQASQRSKTVSSTRVPYASPSSRRAARLAVLLSTAEDRLMTIESIIILMLVAFIVGMMTGISLTRTGAK